MKSLFLRAGVLLCCSLFTMHLYAQRPVEWNAAQIKLHLEKLNVLGRVLYVAAHPDDENNKLLAYLSNGALYRTAYLSDTRGDGGQNLIGDEQGSAMGLLRTQELLAARRIDGAEQYFTRANDFGFSKTATETLKFWGHQQILADVVWVIRKFRPDIIICRFPEDSRAGHGNHWASAILAHEAFNEAANPNKFPEQLKYVKPWQAKRILWNTYHFGSFNTTAPDQFKINDGGYNPLIGESYGEIAADSRSMHKSQGFGVPRTRGESYDFFKTIEGPPPVHSLMDGVNTTWSRIAGGDAIQQMIDKVNAEYDMDDPGKSVPALVKIYTAIQHIKNESWREQKLKEVKQLIQQCAGLYIESDADRPAGVPGQPLGIHSEVINRSNVPITLQKIIYPNDSTVVNSLLPYDNNQIEDKTITLNVSMPVSQPYWLETPHPIGYYNIPDQQLVGRPENIPPVQLTYVFNIDGQDISFTQPVIYNHTDPARGELYEPLAIAPPVTANIENKVYVFTNNHPQEVKITLRSFMDDVHGTLHLQVPAGFVVERNDLPYHLNKTGDEATISFEVHLDHTIQNSVSEQMQAVANFNGKEYKRGYQTIQYSHIPTVTYFPEASAKAVTINLKTGGKNIGYIMGAGDMVPDALRQCGYQVKMLSEGDVMNDDLSGFDAIVTGIRAYNVDKWLQFAQPKLLQYVQHGGTLVEQYNNNRGIVTDQLGPYPFDLSTDRVTEEDAKVTFLQPDNPVLNMPNKITEDDFDGWIQERGLYFTRNADAHYQKIFSMHDTNSPPLDGSTLVTDYGKGKYVYTCLDFFREMPAGVPGAFRLFANMLTGNSNQ